MGQRLLTLAAERIQLMTRAQGERARLAAALVPSDVFATLAARAARTLRWAAGHPLLSGAAAALLLWRRPRRTLGWLVRGLSVWRLYQELRRRAMLT